MYVRNIPHKTSKETASGIATNPQLHATFNVLHSFYRMAFQDVLVAADGRGGHFWNAMNGFGGPHVQNFKQQCFFGFQFLNLGLGASWIQTMRDGMIFWIREQLLLLLLGCCWVAVGLHSWANFEDAWRQHPATILALASV